MDPELKIYTIADLRSWLIDNNPPAGLSEQVIAPVRAYAILNNPYVKDEDAIVAAIYDGDELAAYTAAFPDMIPEGESATRYPLPATRIWWASTLWCNPKFQGQGYGLIVIGSLMEAHEPELTYDRMGAQETIEIFNCLGYDTNYTTRYIYGDKTIERSSLKGKLAYAVQEMKKLLYHRPCTTHTTPYTLRYSNFFDGEAYAFMQNHQGTDLFLREQSMLNWILQYPFMQGGLLTNRVSKSTYFSSDIKGYQITVVKVYKDENLHGVYAYRVRNRVLSVLYLYFDMDIRELVFSSIVEHIQDGQYYGFETENEALAKYVERRIYFPRHSVAQISFSLPVNVHIQYQYTLQMGDGDSFA